MEKIIRVKKNQVGHGEKEYLGGNASYKRVFDTFIDDAVLCNNIVDVDDEFFYNQETGFQTEEQALEELEEKAEFEQNDCDFYQYFIINITEWNLHLLQELEQTTLQIMYSNVLDCYVLGVPHVGTAWDYVGSDFKLDIEEENDAE